MTQWGSSGGIEPATGATSTVARQHDGANNDAVLFGGPILSAYRVGSDLVSIETVDSGTITLIFTGEG
ncbi:MAG: hypothetical protein KGQ66_22290 [Acidobacteriota bacterium]|nr:hypothetical protein [Acidobacteriota bacterium]